MQSTPDPGARKIIHRQPIGPANEFLDTEKQQAEKNNAKYQLDAAHRWRVSRPSGHSKKVPHVHFLCPIPDPPPAIFPIENPVLLFVGIADINIFTNK